MTTLFFDAETTGVSTTKDRIVQISTVKVDEQYNIIEGTKKTFLINPTIPIPAGATEIHGITDEMVKGKPTFAAYSQSMFVYFSDCILAGYNIKRFDVLMLAEEFNRCGISWPAPNTKMIDAFRIFVIKEKRDLSAAVKFYTGKEMEGAHDAEKDNLATLAVFKGQLEMYPELKEIDIDEYCNEGVKTLDLAGKIGVNDKGEAFYTFGKCINVLVKDDPGFAQWMLKNDFPSETKKIINQILTR